MARHGPPWEWRPAHATDSTTPSLITSGDTTDIAVEGPYNELILYWAFDGNGTWHSEAVAGPGTTYSAPSMILNGNTIAISAMGPYNELVFYWATVGTGSTGSWTTETASGV